MTADELTKRVDAEVIRPSQVRQRNRQVLAVEGVGATQDGLGPQVNADYNPSLAVHHGVLPVEDGLARRAGLYGPRRHHVPVAPTALRLLGTPCLARLKVGNNLIDLALYGMFWQIPLERLSRRAKFQRNLLANN